MASRFDKRAIHSNDQEEDRPSLTTFQQQLAQAHDAAEQERLAAHAQALASSTAAPDLTDQVAALTIDETTAGDDPRTLKVRNRSSYPASRPHSSTPSLAPTGPVNDEQ